MPELAQDERLSRCMEHSAAQSAQWLKMLGMPDGIATMVPATESPYSFFFMNQGKPAGAMLAQPADEKSILITGAYIPEPEVREKMFEVLLAAVLDRSLEGKGLDSMLLFRFEEEAMQELVEKFLGPTQAAARQQYYSMEIP